MDSVIERGEPRTEAPSLLRNLLDEEARLRTKYVAESIVNPDEARRDALNYAGLKLGWHRVAPYFNTDNDPNIGEYTDWDRATEKSLGNNWDAMKQLLHKQAEDSRKPGDEDEETAQAFDNMANSL